MSVAPTPLPKYARDRACPHLPSKAAHKSIQKTPCSNTTSYLNKWDSGRSGHCHQASSHFASTERSLAGGEPQRMEATLSDRDAAAAHSFRHLL